MFAHDTPLVTPRGWTTVAEVRVGDLLFDSLGQPVAVAGTGPWVVGDACWKVVFDDGAAVTVSASQEWLTMNAAERVQAKNRSEKSRALYRARSTRRPRSNMVPSPALARSWELFRERQPARRLPVPAPSLRTTAEVASSVNVGNGFSFNYRMDVASPLDLPDIAQPLHPYLLSRHLAGDPAPTEEAVAFQRGVPEAQPRAVDSRRRPLLCAMRRSDLFSVYLRGSITQRTWLLKGLMDAVGGYCRGGRCGLWFVDPAVAGEVHELVASLGYKVERREQVGWQRRTSGFSEVSWGYRSDRAVPFRDPVLVGGLPQRTHSRQAFRYVVRCEAVDPVPTRWIAVDGGSATVLVGRGMCAGAAAAAPARLQVTGNSAAAAAR